MVKDVDLNEHLQQEVLQLLLHDLDLYNKSKHLLKKEYFTHLPAQIIYQKIEEAHSIYGAFPTKGSLLQTLQNSPSQTYKEAASIVDSLVDKLYQPLPSNQAEIAQAHFLEFIKHRRLQELYTHSLTHLKEGKYTEALDVIDAAREDITLTPIDHGIRFEEGLVERIVRRVTKDEETLAEDVIATPYKAFNEVITRGGLAKKQTAVIVGGTGVGKSVLLMNIAGHAVLQGKFVVYVTLENTLEETQDRFDGYFLGRPQRDLYFKSRETAEELPLIIEAIKAGNGELLIKEYLPAEATVPMIEKFIVDTEARLGRRCDMLIIDYADEMKLQKSVFSETRAIWQEHFTKITGLAKKLDVVLWTATQGNTSSHEQEILTKASVSEGVAKLRPVPYVLGMSKVCTIGEVAFYNFNVLKSRIGKENQAVKFRLEERGLYFKEATDFECSQISDFLERAQANNRFSKGRKAAVANSSNYSLGTDKPA